MFQCQMVTTLLIFRFRDDVQEDLEESISNPTDNVTIMSVADQIEILEVWHPTCS